VTQRFQFTKARLNAIKPPAKGRLYVYDKARPTLALVTTATGHQSFYWRKKFDGKAVRVKIGTYPDISIEQARKDAAKHDAQAAKGNDPTETIRKRRADKLTVGEARKLYLKGHAEIRNRPSTLISNESLWRTTLEPTLAKKLLSAVKPNTLRDHHTKLAKTRGERTANRAMQYLRTVYNYAKSHHGYKGDIPTVTIDWYAEGERDRHLSPDEMVRFLAALQNRPQPFRDLLLLCLLTGARSGNVRSMKWADMNLPAKTWAISPDDAKEGRKIHVPLVPDAVDILNRRRGEQADDPSVYVFPATRGATVSKYISPPQRHFHAARAEAEIEDFKIHDLRHTNASWQASAGASLLTIGATLGHRDQRSTKRYAHIAEQVARESAERAAAAMMKGGKAK